MSGNKACPGEPCSSGAATHEGGGELLLGNAAHWREEQSLPRSSIISISLFYDTVMNYALFLFVKKVEQMAKAKFKMMHPLK